MFLLGGCVFLVITLWDRAAARRWFPEEETASNTQTSSTGQPLAVANALTTNELILPPGSNALERDRSDDAPVRAGRQR